MVLVMSPSAGQTSADDRRAPAVASSDPGTDFGFRRVAPDEKARLVKGVFESVAARYDLMNDLMSWGVHRLWKTALMDRLRPQPGMRLVDVGGGTGDIALRFLKRGGASVTVIDASTAMLAVGRDRAVDEGVIDGIAWVCGDA